MRTTLPISGQQSDLDMDFSAARKAMVESQVRPNDVTDLRIQQVLEEIPRERFLPGSLRDFAYADREHVVGDGQGERVLLRPRDFAKLVHAAEPAPSGLVLDVGCGTGYSSAILAKLSDMVVAVEPDEVARAAAIETLADLAIDNAAFVEGDMSAGAAAQGPYDLIFIGGGISVEPTLLLEQLKPNGRLVAIWVENAAAKACIWQRSGGDISRVTVFDAASRFILPDFVAKPTFRF